MPNSTKEEAHLFYFLYIMCFMVSLGDYIIASHAENQETIQPQHIKLPAVNCMYLSAKDLSPLPC